MNTKLKKVLLGFAALLVAVALIAIAPISRIVYAIYDANRILNKYNSIYKLQLPKITPHVCRHTFCSNMAKSGMNPKTLQYIMGHSDISVTLDTYTHLKFEDAKVEFDRVLEA